MRYRVFYEIDGMEKSKDHADCKDAGMAFARTQKLYPGAKMLHCTASSGIRGFEAKMEHEPPPVQRDPVKDPRPPRPPKPNEQTGAEMPFYNEVVTAKPFG